MISRMAIPLLLGASLAASGMAFAQSAQPRMTGTWRFTCTNRRGRSRRISVRMRQNGSRLSGTFRNARGSDHLSGEVSRDRITLVLNDRRGSLSLSGTIADGTMHVRSKRGIACAATRH